MKECSFCGIIDTEREKENSMTILTTNHPKFGIKKLKKMSFLKRSLLRDDCIDLIRSKGYINIRTSNMELAVLGVDQIRDVRDMIDTVNSTTTKK